MSKFLTVKDFDLTQIGRCFEVQEVRDYVDRAVSYTHLTLPTKEDECRSRWSPYH